MKFSLISNTFEKMESTSKRLELTQHLVDLFKSTPKESISKVVYLIQGKLRPDYEGVELGIAEKLAIRAISKSAGIPIKKIEEAFVEDGDLGHAASKILEQKTQTTFLMQQITAERVYETLFKIAKLEGARSQDMKMKYISSLLNDATPQEAKFILKMIMGTLRLGIADNTVMDALAIAFTGSRENRERLESAYNVSSDLGKVAEAVSHSNIDGLKNFHITLFNPIRPMLAERVKSAVEATEKLGKEFVAEYKLDGERVQIHFGDQKVILFSRRLENITNYYPDIIENIPKALKTNEVILEAEAVAVNENSGEFLPFQELMHRRRKYDIAKIVEQYPITVNLFDVLYLNGKDLLNSTYAERRKRLEEITLESEFIKLVPKTTVRSESEIEDFLENGINAGCEGLMLKVLDAPYRA
ncbi:MAG: ATP-dependent DNA ligase, partial [Nitrososphaerales archaeon]